MFYRLRDMLINLRYGLTYLQYNKLIPRNRQQKFLQQATAKDKWTLNRETDTNSDINSRNSLQLLFEYTVNLVFVLHKTINNKEIDDIIFITLQYNFMISLGIR